MGKMCYAGGVENGCCEENCTCGFIPEGYCPMQTPGYLWDTPKDPLWKERERKRMERVVEKNSKLDEWN